jgi:hypothetical protein
MVGSLAGHWRRGSQKVDTVAPLFVANKTNDSFSGKKETSDITEPSIFSLESVPPRYFPYQHIHGSAQVTGQVFFRAVYDGFIFVERRIQ